MFQYRLYEKKIILGRLVEQSITQAYIQMIREILLFVYLYFFKIENYKQFLKLALVKCHINVVFFFLQLLVLI